MLIKENFDKLDEILKNLKNVRERISLIKDTCCFSTNTLDESEIDEIIYSLEEFIKYLELFEL